MKSVNGYGNQQGATLIVGLIMLLLFTLMISSAFMMSSTNLKAVGNMQSRSEALAAANKVVEDVVSTDFVGAGTQEFQVDMNNDLTPDYQVQIAEPVCVKASISREVAPSSVNLVVMSSNTWNTVWEVNATASDSVGGASVNVRVGVRVLLSDSLKNTHCS
ncbi:hypothetical protein D3C78_504040 [compost metagenome]